MNAIELAVYADNLAAEAAGLAARAERARSRLRQAAIERAARAELSAPTIARLETVGLLCTDAGRAAEEHRRLGRALAAVEELQAWVEAGLAAAQAVTAESLVRYERGVSATSSPPSSS